MCGQTNGENPLRFSKIAFRASEAKAAQDAYAHLTAIFDAVPAEEADVIVALGGDGFMLQTLHDTQKLKLPVYGMNCGTIGFLMNAYGVDGLLERLDASEEATINPLKMKATSADGTVTKALAINEVSLLRAGPQAAKLRIFIDGKEDGRALPCA